MMPFDSKIDHSSSLEKIFVKGGYDHVVRSTVDLIESGATDLDSALEVSSKDVPWVVGSLGFVGRQQEAQLLFEQERAYLSAEGLAASLFFLAIATLRQSELDQARHYLYKLYQAVRRQRDAELSDQTFALLEFYLAQGFGFYRYMTGAIGRARYWADRSFNAAFKARFNYGRVLAMDLKGYVYLQSGQIRAGLELLDKACLMAEKLGQGAVVQALRASILIYKAKHGVEHPRKMQDALACAAEQCSLADSYSKASLILEQAQLALLCGKASQAKALLDNVCQLVYRVEGLNLHSLLNFRMAYLFFRRGEYHQALLLLQSAKNLVEKQRNLVFDVQVLGLEARLMKSLGQEDTYKEIIRKLILKTKHSQNFIGERAANRQLENKVSYPPGEDPLGDLIDLATTEKVRAVNEILRLDYHGLLYDALSLGYQQSAIYFDLSSRNTLTIFHEGDVTFLAKGLTSQIRKLFIALSDGEKSKEKLTELIWGQSYHPLRHDQTIYTLVSKARKLLGPYAEWLAVTELGYQLDSRVQVKEGTGETAVPGRQNQAADAPLNGLTETGWSPNSLTGRKCVPFAKDSDINFRQSELLGSFRDISTQEYVRYFKVSDATASRDLSELYVKGYLKRLGKGRSTRYVINASSAKEKL